MNDVLTPFGGIMDRLSRAWGAGDPDAYADEFTPHCVYIAFFGGIYRGREEIAASHRLLFAGPLKGTRLFHDIVSEQVIGEDIIVVVTRGDAARSAPRRLKKVQTYVLKRSADRWLVAHFQNTKQSTLMRWLTYRNGPDAVPSLDRAA